MWKVRQPLHRNLPEVPRFWHVSAGREQIAKVRRRQFLLATTCTALVGVLLLCGCASTDCRNLDATKCRVLADFRVFGPENELRFEHRCSGPGYTDGASRGAYVFFEATLPEPAKMLVLSRISLGWVGPHGGQSIQGIDLTLHRLRASGLAGWRGDGLSLRLLLEAVETGETVAGNIISDYVELWPNREPHTRPFSVSASGSIDWERFIEPGKAPDKEAAKFYRHPDASTITFEKLRRPAEAHRLLLVVTNRESGEQIRLQGPVLNKLAVQPDLEKPTMRALGLLATLNPTQKGGLWDWLRSTAKYGDCIYTRRAAKQMFDARYLN